MSKSRKPEINSKKEKQGGITCYFIFLEGYPYFYMDSMD